MGEHGRFNAKRFAYDEALRVPFLIRYPKLITPGSVREELVLNIDVAPTLLDLAGVESIIPMHGKSISAPVAEYQCAVERGIPGRIFSRESRPKNLHLAGGSNTHLEIYPLPRIRQSG